jgi:hypothetical protein
MGGFTESSMSVSLDEGRNDETGRRHANLRRHVELIETKSCCVSNLLRMAVRKR